MVLKRNFLSHMPFELCSKWLSGQMLFKGWFQKMFADPWFQSVHEP